METRPSAVSKRPPAPSGAPPRPSHSSGLHPSMVRRALRPPAGS